MAILAVDSIGNVSCISELFNQKWLKCLYRIFMQSFFCSCQSADNVHKVHPEPAKWGTVGK